MIDRVLTKIFGTQHERDIKKLLPRVARINALEPSMRRSGRRRTTSVPGWPRRWKESPRRS